mmetsp:Transcript_10485/g.18000  ORF Transcript_10485/g.18000 Transcript_10485/m.18000 type:complete len:720 (-) Transcript_10485:197-2356(-)
MVGSHEQSNNVFMSSLNSYQLQMEAMAGKRQPRVNDMSRQDTVTDTVEMHSTANAESSAHAVTTKRQRLRSHAAGAHSKTSLFQEDSDDDLEPTPVAQFGRKSKAQGTDKRKRTRLPVKAKTNHGMVYTKRGQSVPQKAASTIPSEKRDNQNTAHVHMETNVETLVETSQAPLPIAPVLPTSVRPPVDTVEGVLSATQPPPSGRESVETPSGVHTFMPGTQSGSVSGVPRHESPPMYQSSQGPQIKPPVPAISAGVIVIDKARRTRTKSQGSKKREKRCALSFEELRFIIRLGLLPILSSDDAFWYKSISTYVTRHQAIGKYIIGSPQDPFKDMRMPDGTIPASSAVLEEDSILAVRYTNCIAVRNDIMRIARRAMYAVALKLFGEASGHEQIFSKFDVVEWCKGYEIRMLLLKSKELMQKKFPESCCQKMQEFDFEERAHIGIKLLAVLFAGMMAAFRAGWEPTQSAFQRHAEKLVDAQLVAKVREIGYPACTRRWLRILLFSLPKHGSDDPKALDSTTETLSEIGINLEYLCLFQLSTVMHIETSQLANMRAPIPSRLDKLPRRESQSEGSAYTLFTCKRSPQVPVVAAQKAEPYPWNKRLRWFDNTNDLMFQVRTPDGDIEIEKRSRYAEICKMIRESRNRLVSNCNKVCVSAIRDKPDGWVDLLADLILEHLQGVDISPLYTENGSPISDGTCDFVFDETQGATFGLSSLECQFE